MTLLEAHDKSSYGRIRLPAWPPDQWVIYEYGKLWWQDGREYIVTDNYVAGILSRDWLPFEEDKP